MTYEELIQIALDDNDGEKVKLFSIGDLINGRVQKNPSRMTIQVPDELVINLLGKEGDKKALGFLVVIDEGKVDEIKNAPKYVDLILYYGNDFKKEIHMLKENADLLVEFIKLYQDGNKEGVEQLYLKSVDKPYIEMYDWDSIYFDKGFNWFLDVFKGRVMTHIDTNVWEDIDLISWEIK